MSQIKLSQDDAQFLRDLQNELLTQPNDGNAYRNYELARLLKILKTMEIKED